MKPRTCDQNGDMDVTGRRREDTSDRGLYREKSVPTDT